MSGNMRRKFIAAIAVLALVFLGAPSVDARNIIKVGKDINIGEDQAVNNAVAIAGQITVSGLVENNVATVGGSIVLTNEAVVRGNVICIGGVVVQGNGAQVFGNITEVNSSNISTAVASAFYGDMDAWSWLVDIIYFCFFAMILMLALLMATLFPRPLNAIADSIQGNKAKSFFWGFLATLMIAPFFMLLIFSFIGILLMPLAFAALLLAFMFGFIGVSALLGNFVLTKIFHRQNKSLVEKTLLGLILLWFSGWIPFYIGTIIKTVAITIGFGGVFLALFQHRHHHVAPPPITGDHVESTIV
jgi:MFS family permease